MERVKGVEPSLRAWEAPVLPLNYTRFAVKASTWARAEEASASRL